MCTLAATADDGDERIGRRPVRRSHLGERDVALAPGARAVATTVPSRSATHVVDDSLPSTHRHSAADRGIVTSHGSWTACWSRSIAATSPATAGRTTTPSTGAGAASIRCAGAMSMAYS